MKNTTKFLDAVADYIVSNDSATRGTDLRDTLLLFPNKRAVIFMRRYLKRRLRGAGFMPKLRTYGSFVAELVGLREASRMEQLFTLYDAYWEVSNSYDQNPAPFDRFRYWGELILNDFEDVDLQSADAESIFTNLQRLHEIQTDFLDEEQRKVAMEIWGYDPGESFDGFKKSHLSKGDKDLVYNNFVRLSEILYPIYSRFHELLLEKQLTTRGKIARQAAHILQDPNEDKPLPERIAFIGFSILSDSEKRVFTEIKKKGIAQFFWDVPDMLLRDLPETMGKYYPPLLKYINSLIKEFPAPQDFSLPECPEMPEIQIIGAPSNTMQTKVCGNIIDNLSSEGILRPERPDDTAIVLPDASLLIPLLYSLNVSQVNVTMGLPVRHTPFATLLSMVIRLNMSARTDADGDWVFLTQNVVQIASHPSLTVLLPAQTDMLRDYIESHGRFVTKLSDILRESPDLGFIFKPMGAENSLVAAKEFICGLIDGLLALIENVSGSQTPELADKSGLHEFRVLKAMQAAVDNLVVLMAEHPLIEETQSLGTFTFIRLIEKQLFKEQLNFSGSPLTGVQIMGALETRSLDFENIVVLSMNEKTFPPRNIIRSMLPLSLRGAFGLTIPEKKELEYAWIYANLMSRCKRAYIVYNTTGDKVGMGGMSRYIFQTRFLYNRPNPQFINISPAGVANTGRVIEIQKTDSVRKELDRYRAGGDKVLSVSALERFGECPLKFYLSNVKDVAEPKRISESIDAIALGNMVHHAMGEIFKIVEKEYGGVMGESFTISDDKIEEFLVKALSKEWYSGIPDTYAELPQQAQIQIDIWKPKVIEIVNLERERPDGPYQFVQSEFSPKNLTGDRVFNWEISPDLTVRFTFYVDRVDRLSDGQLRFIDYKTGSDALKVTNMDNLFWTPTADGKAPTPNKFIFQLLTYANAYEEVLRQKGENLTSGIKLEVTKVLTPALSVGKPLKIYNTPITDHRSECVKEFLPRFKEFVEKIFDPNTPFTQTPFEDNCRYCQFKNICQRNVEKEF